MAEEEKKKRVKRRSARPEGQQKDNVPAEKTSTAQTEKKEEETKTTTSTESTIKKKETKAKTTQKTETKAKAKTEEKEGPFKTKDKEKTLVKKTGRIDLSGLKGKEKQDGKKGKGGGKATKGDDFKTLEDIETKPHGGKKPDKNRGTRKFNNNTEGEDKKDKRILNQKKQKNADIDTKIKKQRKTKQKPVEEAPLPEGTVLIDIPITVTGFAKQIGSTAADVIGILFKMGTMRTATDDIDEDIVLLVADELGVDVKIGKTTDDVINETISNETEDEKDLVHRAPIVTVMGHVDHGKTSLLDAIRDSGIASGEAGGITQHIGASEIGKDKKRIVFLDTPGHEAFTSMRARGAHATDIAVLVVAADDGVMPQTIESINHAKAAGVAIIVAINKIDKEGANIDNVKKELSDNGLLASDWGGDIEMVPVSAKKKEGIDDLLEMILLQAELLELKANPNRNAEAVIIESKLDKQKGVVASLLVMNGTLKMGDNIVAGTAYGKIKNMQNYFGKNIKVAPPATPVEILGLNETPDSGEQAYVTADEATAKKIATAKVLKIRSQKMTSKKGLHLDSLFSEVKSGDMKTLNLIVKVDVMGSLAPITTTLSKMSNEEVSINIIHEGVGAITDSDVTLAETADAIIIAFNVRPTITAKKLADESEVEIRNYNVIYNITDDIEKAVKGMLEPETKEEILGRLEVRELFRGDKIGTVAGSYVLNGIIKRNAKARLIRDGKIITETDIESLKRFKDDVKEVKEGFECGIKLVNFDDIKENDEVECFEIVEV